MIFSVIANSERPAVFQPIEFLASWSEKNGHKVLVCPEVFSGMQEPPSSIEQCATEKEAVDKSDIVMTSGGDGTILWAARLILDSGKKILGVNSGRMGFLANIQNDQLEQALNAVVENNYQLDKRFLLKATDNLGHTDYALNEFLFSKKGQASMITLTVECDGVFVNKYWADGILVSTPTGSTAYNLSSGGPIVTPETNVLVLTPINPHNLTTRPIVLPGHKPIKVYITPEDQEVLFSNDGEISQLTGPVKSVEIKRTDFTLDLIQLTGQSYFDTLRTKLMWGADIREKL